MFNFRYNILAVYQVILGLLNSLLLIRVFGVSNKADAYLMASSIVASLQFVQLMVVEQFMFFYNDLKVEDRQNARDFYTSAVTFALLSGGIFYLVYALAVHPLIKVFAFGIDGERYQLLRSVLQIMFVGVVADSANTINQRLLNAEMRFSIPYILNSLQSLFAVLLLLYLMATKNTSVELIAAARTCGICVACLGGFAVLRRMGFSFRPSLRHPALKPFIKNSITMRFGLNIHNLLLTPITNNVLACLPSGFPSYFYYAQKLHQVVGSVVISPCYSVFHARVSRQWSEQNLAGIRENIRHFLPLATVSFVATTALAFYLLPTALGIVSSRSLGASDIAFIRSMFLAMIPWYLIALVESPFLSVCIASKRSSVLIASNSLFIAAYFLLSLLLVSSTGIYTIPFALSTAQVINLVSFAAFCKVLLKGSEQTVVNSAV
jgi:lipid II flippase MurJ-like protein